MGASCSCFHFVKSSSTLVMMINADDAYADFDAWWSWWCWWHHQHDQLWSLVSDDEFNKSVSFSISFSSRQHAPSPTIFSPTIIIKSLGGRAGGFSLWCDLGSDRPRWRARGSASGCLIVTMMLMTMVNMMIMMMLLLLLLLPSAMHWGNFARFSSFLNKGTITSSTRAQNCSDHDTVFDILGMNLESKRTSKPTYVWLIF